MVLQVAHAINRYRSLSLKTSALLLLLLAPPLSEARAYNQDTHQLLVDYTWQIMLAVDVVGRNAAPPDQPFQQLSVSPDFSRRVQEAVRKIHLLPANLPAPKDSRCIDPAMIQKLGTNTPNWAWAGPRPRTCADGIQASGARAIAGIGAGQVLGRLAGKRTSGLPN